MISIPCPACQRRLHVPEGLADQQVSCPGCGHVFALESASAIADVVAVEPPRKRRGLPGWAWAVIITTGVGLVFVSLAVYFIASLATRLNQPKPIVAQSGLSRVMVPSHWQPRTDLNQLADLQAEDPFDEAYLIVISEPKTDFEAGTTVDEFARLSVDSMRDWVGNCQVVSGPTPTTANGRPAVRYEVRGTVDRIQVVFYHVSAEGPAHFHQVMAWTLPSRVGSVKGTLDQALASFQEVGPAAGR